MVLFAVNPFVSEGNIDDENSRFWHRPLLVSDEITWCPNDNAKNANTLTGRSQHDTSYSYCCELLVLVGARTYHIHSSFFVGRYTIIKFQTGS